MSQLKSSKTFCQKLTFYFQMYFKWRLFNLTSDQPKNLNSIKASSKSMTVIRRIFTLKKFYLRSDVEMTNS